MYPIHAVILRRFTCRLAALLAVRSSQSEREAAFLYLKFHAAHFGVFIDTLTLAGILRSVISQSFLEVSVMGSDMEKGILLVEEDFCVF